MRFNMYQDSPIGSYHIASNIFLDVQVSIGELLEGPDFLGS